MYRSFMLARYEMKNEDDDVKEAKKHFFANNDYFVPVLKGYAATREYERVKEDALKLDMAISHRIEEKENYDKYIVEIKINSNLKMEMIKVEHEEHGEMLYLEKCLILGEKISKQDMDELNKLL